MGCVNSRYTPDELESIFIWDLLCEAIPLDSGERKAANARDAAIKAENEGKKKTQAPKPTDEEAIKKRREYAAKWREAHREEIRAKDRAYKAKNRETINERQRGYERSKRFSEHAALAAQP